MYRVYDTFKKCCYTIEEAKKVKNENPTAPPERWLFVAVHDDIPDNMVYEDLVVVRPCSNSELSLSVSYDLKELRLLRYTQSMQEVRTMYVEKYGVRLVRVASITGNKKTMELLLGCRTTAD